MHVVKNGLRRFARVLPSGGHGRYMQGNMQLLLQCARLRGPEGKVLVASSNGLSTAVCSGVKSGSSDNQLQTQVPVPIRPERLRKYVRIEWSPQETLSFIKIMLEESPKFFDEHGQPRRNGFYKYIEDTYVTHKKQLHEDRNLSTIRSYWGDLCRTIRDPKYRGAAVALYDLDEGSVSRILDIPDVQLPSKGKKYEENRIKAVIRKYKDPFGLGEAHTSKEASQTLKRQRAPPCQLNL